MRPVRVCASILNQELTNMKALYKISLLLGAVGVMVSSCNDEMTSDKTGNTGKSVRISLSASRANTDPTRTSLSEGGENGGLNCVWTKNDKLLVTNDEGRKLGYLKLDDEFDQKDQGQFNGTIYIEDGKYNLNFYYLGTSVAQDKEDKKAYSEVESSTPYVADFSNQEGTFLSLSDYDILTATKETVIDGDYIYFGNINFERRVSFAQFEMINLPEIEYPITVTISGEMLCNKASVSLSDLDDNRVKVDYMKGDVKVNIAKKDENNNFYITLLPTTSGGLFTFHLVDKGGKAFTTTYQVNNPVKENIYYHKAVKNDKDEVTGYEGIPLDFTPDAPEYDIIFMTYPEGTPNNEEFDHNEDLTDPSNVELPGDPKPENHKEFLGWKIEGSEDEPTEGPWNLTEEGKGPVVTLVPVYSDSYVWNIEWRCGYGDNHLVEYQGQTTYTYAHTNPYTQIKKTNVKVTTPYGINGNNTDYNPTREGCTFIGWHNPAPSGNSCKATDEKTANQTYSSDNWTVVFTAMWNRVYEIVYHFNSANPKHSYSGEHNSTYNAAIIDRPTGVEDGYVYGIRFDNEFFADQEGLANKDKLIGWKRFGCADHYTDGSIDNLIFKEGDTFEFKDGKYILHLEPVYAEPENKVTITHQGYNRDTFNK